MGVALEQTKCENLNNTTGAVQTVEIRSEPVNRVECKKRFSVE